MSYYICNISSSFLFSVIPPPPFNHGLYTGPLLFTTYTAAAVRHVVTFITAAATYYHNNPTTTSISSYVLN